MDIEQIMIKSMEDVDLENRIRLKKEVWISHLRMNYVVINEKGLPKGYVNVIEDTYKYVSIRVTSFGVCTEKLRILVSK